MHQIIKFVDSINRWVCNQKHLEYILTLYKMEIYIDWKAGLIPVAQTRFLESEQFA